MNIESLLAGPRRIIFQTRFMRSKYSLSNRDSRCIKDARIVAVTFPSPLVFLVFSAVEAQNANIRRSLSGKELFTRADTFDLNSLDIQLEKKLSKVLIDELGASFSRNKPQHEECEIDASKLDIRYGTVLRGTYDGKDVAVKLKLLDWGSEDIVTDAETLERRSSFDKEVTVWHKLNHPNVTQGLRPKIPQCCPSKAGKDHEVVLGCKSGLRCLCWYRNWRRLRVRA